MAVKKPVSRQVKVALGSRSYDVHVGAGIVSQLGRLYKSDSKRAVLVSDVRLKVHREATIGVLKASGWQVTEIPVEAGEALKDLERLYPIYGQMLKAGLDRGSTLFALGGGTIGDAAGFVASTYLRGIAWVGIPTTLLSQVDSSVGGKTAVNHPQGKNLIGTFFQPSAVICDTNFLNTLSERELISGLGEVVKYGLSMDAEFFDFIRENWDLALRRDPAVMSRLVKESIQLKAKTVGKDEFDRKGIREVLNFGHTFGHALETVTDYKVFQHGEAVIWGMRFAAALSKTKKRLSDKNWREADSFLRRIAVPALPTVAAEKFFAPMIHDKKAKDGKVRFVLLKKIGETILDRAITADDLLLSFNLMKDGR